MSSEKQQQQDIINNKGNDEEAYLEEIERKIMARAEEEQKKTPDFSKYLDPLLTFKQPETLILEPPKMSDQKVKKKKNTKKNICYFSSPLTKKKHTKIHRT